MAEVSDSERLKELVAHLKLRIEETSDTDFDLVLEHLFDVRFKLFEARADFAWLRDNVEILLSAIRSPGMNIAEVKADLRIILDAVEGRETEKRIQNG